jgi:uncharacterized protein YbaP (TraB family)
MIVGVKLALVAVAAGLFSAPAAAAGPPESPPPVAVEGLVVTARTAGPAWWRVGRGDAVVWILGVPPTLPKGFAWNTRALDQHLTGARTAITPAVGTANLFAIPALLGLEHRMRTRTPLEDQLSPDLRARFLADAGALHKPPARYDHWNGLVAALFMIRDFEQAASLDYAGAMPVVDREIRAHGVKSRPAATYKALDILRTGAAEIDQPLAQACLAVALDEVEGGKAREDRAAEAWAHGDTAVALTASTGFERCLEKLPETARVARQSIADETAAIAAALQQPGASVAFIPLRHLLDDGGVLRQLQERGFRIEGPDVREARPTNGPAESR